MLCSSTSTTSSSSSSLLRALSARSFEPYRNDFGQFLRLRWLKVTKDFVIEDTQRFERACRRLAVASLQGPRA
jgi:hypothetical protein